ncbi:phosphofructokinase [Chitinivibrio alkaliphilus ACht1]|uniref:ATP-dependent 6-phosphofructokinase n=2 Tax=Chitinivibrio TaxID=1505231 RepID=U7DE98_9BACT|nr:phosphofructokinase [Chitinivibrio alkaliphilus ACht1]
MEYPFFLSLRFAALLHGGIKYILLRCDILIGGDMAAIQGLENSDFRIQKLGECSIDTPLSYSERNDDKVANFTKSGTRVVLNGRLYSHETESFKPLLLEAAGPRNKIYFDPSKVKAGIVTCGGLCPGLNNVIKGLVHSLSRYGVQNIIGFQHGFMGMLPDFSIPFMELNRSAVSGIHREGGTILGTSRGFGERTEDIVDTLEKMNINMFFTIGGDGTQKGALRISEECQRRGLKIAVVGIPKTIDNDLSFVRKSFGFETAVDKAVESVYSASVEAKSVVNGIGLVKLMGRESGFIAAHTALASSEADIVLVPEVPFSLEGKRGLFATIDACLAELGRAVIVVAEGAGQDLLRHFEERYREVDASGNKKIGDVGIYLRDQIIDHFRSLNRPMTMKYIDPSYIIRSQAANPNDSLYCSRLASNAVHAAMSGKTSMLTGLVHNYYVNIPIEMAVAKRNSINPDSSLWRGVLESTGQPPRMV